VDFGASTMDGENLKYGLHDIYIMIYYRQEEIFPATAGNLLGR